MIEKLTWFTVKMKVRELIPNILNPRVWKKGGETELDASFEKFDLVEIPVVNLDGTLIAGHRRLERMMNAGWIDREIDVRRPNRQLSEEEVLEYMIRSNTHQGTWDLKMLTSDLFAGLDLGQIGLDMKEVPGWKARDMVIEEDDFEIDLPFAPITVSGDVYELNSIKSKLYHRLMCGDSTSKDDVKKLLLCRVPVLMVTDPPYGVEYDPTWRKTLNKRNMVQVGKVANDDQASWLLAYSLFPGDVAYVWHGGKHAAVVANDLENAGFQIVSQIIWNKQSGAISRGDIHWKHEPCWYAVRVGKKHNWQGARDVWTVWDIPNQSNRKLAEEEGQSGHSTQKPIEAMGRPIRNNTEPRQSVYDCFLGSGTTLVACEQLLRHCSGMEIEAKYVDVALRRWIQYMQKKNLDFQILRNGLEVSDDFVASIISGKTLS